MLTREEFDRRRAVLKAVARREGRVLASISVSLGLAQLLFHRWAEPQMAHDAFIVMAGSLFLAYIVGVAAQLWRMQRRVRAARLACPHCRALTARSRGTPGGRTSARSSAPRMPAGNEVPPVSGARRHPQVRNSP